MTIFPFKCLLNLSPVIQYFQLSEIKSTLVVGSLSLASKRYSND